MFMFTVLMLYGRSASLRLVVTQAKRARMAVTRRLRAGVIALRLHWNRRGGACLSAPDWSLRL